MTDSECPDIVVQYGAGVVEDDHIRAALTADGHYILIANHFLVKALGLNAPYNQIKQYHKHKVKKLQQNIKVQNFHRKEQ